MRLRRIQASKQNVSPCFLDVQLVLLHSAMVFCLSINLPTSNFKHAFNQHFSWTQFYSMKRICGFAKREGLQFTSHSYRVGITNEGFPWHLGLSNFIWAPNSDIATLCQKHEGRIIRSVMNFSLNAYARFWDLFPRETYDFPDYFLSLTCANQLHVLSTYKVLMAYMQYDIRRSQMPSDTAHGKDNRLSHELLHPAYSQ